MEYREQSYLRPLWDAILDLYERFDAYCKAHGLRYYVTGGTLLGAVRHNGFIPWDDDFDVVMPRPDYTRFIMGWETNPIPNANLNSVEVAEVDALFAKVSDSRQESLARICKECSCNIPDPIRIDVIPIDGMPKATLPFYYWAIRRHSWLCKSSKRRFWRILFTILWPGDRSPAAFQKWLASYDYDTSPCVEDYNGNERRFKMRCLSAASFGTPIMHKFDRLQVPIPQEWDKFLKCIFGQNYMTLPPLEKQVPSHISAGAV